MATIDLNYIECAGVRVPSDWSVDQLREALSKRNIRFSNEEDIMVVFGKSIQLKASLEEQISTLQAEVTRLDKYVKEKQKRALCPQCGKLWMEAPTLIKTKPIPKHNKGNKNQ